MLSHFALVYTGNLSLSSVEANGIMGKTSRIIKENAGINSVRKKKSPTHPAFSFKTRESYFFLVPLNCVLSVLRERSTYCN